MQKMPNLDLEKIIEFADEEVRKHFQAWLSSELPRLRIALINEHLEAENFAVRRNVCLSHASKIEERIEEIVSGNWCPSGIETDGPAIQEAETK